MVNSLKNQHFKISINTISILLLLISNVAHANLVNIRIGVYDFPPVASTIIQNPPNNLFQTIIDDAVRHDDWEVEYVPGTLQECINNLMNDKIDIIMAMPYRTDILDLLDYSEKTVISTWAQVYTTKSISLHSILDLEDKSVGVMLNDPYNEELRHIIKGFNISCQFVEFKNYDEMLDGLNKGWIDAAVIDRLYSTNNKQDYAFVKSPVLFSPMQLRFATAEGKNIDLLGVLDYHISEQKKNPNSEYNRFLNRIFGSEERSVIPNWVLCGIGCIVMLLILVLVINYRQQKRIESDVTQLDKYDSDLKKEVKIRQSKEYELQESQELLNKVFASMLDALLVTNYDNSRILLFNPVAERMFGYEINELLLLDPLSTLLTSSDSREFRRNTSSLLTSKGFLSTRVGCKRKNGDIFPAELSITQLLDPSGKEVKWVVIVRDITEIVNAEKALKSSELQLRQSQKMEAIGRLAGGIAHDFNNMLTPIFGYTDILLLSDQLDNESKSYLIQIQTAANRAKDIIQQILAFSRRSEVEYKPFNLRVIVKESFKLLRATIPATIEMKSHIDIKNDIITGDPTQIHQILLNLCTNAFQAIPDGVGKIELTLKNHTGDPEGWPDGLKLSHDKEYALLSVYDNGTGIEHDRLHKIFEPFYTTKKHGEGTGMGLSVVHGIVKNHGGTITVETEPGVGSCFNIYMPLEKVETKPEIKKTLDYCKGNGEKIFIVDDESMIVNVLMKVLENMGYNVISSTDPGIALEMFRENPNDIDLVITDMNMPGMNGCMMAAEMINIRPNIPVILCTGYNEKITPQKVFSLGIKEYLLKPVSSNELSQIIRRVLDSSGNGSIHKYTDETDLLFETGVTSDSLN